MFNIMENLTNCCTFSSEWEHTSPGDGLLKNCQHPVNEMGYFRCDHDGRQWWRYPFQVHKDMETKERIAELEAVTEALTEAFPTLKDLEKYCVENAEDLRNDFEYNLYYSGVECNYWIRARIVKQDYNLYVHALAKTN